MCVCASGIQMVCKKNTNDLYWFEPRNALCPVGKVSFVLSRTEVLVVGVTSGWEREELPSLKVWVECVCVWLYWCPRNVQESYLFVCPGFFLSGTVPACFFYSLKEVQGYKMLLHGVILVGGAQRPREGLIRWWRGPHCGGMALVLLALLLHV
jgi:hypothetical protein